MVKFVMSNLKLPQQVISTQRISFEDFLTQYDGQRVEWHAGKVVQQVTNNPQHNAILLFLSYLFKTYLDLTKQGQLILAGVPMYISDEQPAREPDLMILLPDSAERLTKQYLDGPADIAIEIISPGTGYIDRGAKFVEYEQAGVKEYWLIDPLREELLVYRLDADGIFRPAPRDASNKAASTVLAGFALDPTLLWQEVLPEAMAIVDLAQQMAADASQRG